MRRRWTALLAPLGIPTCDGRILSTHGQFTLAEPGGPYGVPPLIRAGASWPTVRLGTLNTLTVDHQWLVGSGVVWEPETVELMERQQVWPEISLTHAHCYEAVPGQLVFVGGTVAALAAGTLPPWPDVRFILEES